MTTLEDIPFLADNPAFRHLADVADISALNQGERQRYDESIKTMRDHISAYETAINKGRREGEAKGRSEGLKEGLSLVAVQTARRMKAKGLTLEFISEMTGLSPEEIASL